MKKLIVLISVLTLVACGSSRNTASDEKFVVENLQKYSSEELKNRYPNANFREDVGMFEEGTVERAYTILYPDTPNELHITWKDKSRTKIHDIRFDVDGQWKSSEGIAIGTTYDELNKLNGKEISFYGFGWDYSGAVMWNEGKLEDSGLRVFLAPQNDPGNKFYGDRLIEASPEEIEALDLRVETIMLIN
ncbi:MAG TPA: hypothetical protein VIM94_06535 [Salegentibacter sp.]|uniref:hypothetical protein n=1 Tax=Salegentibacter sp. TaxID=1903072 RepID=UPI002F923393